MCRDGRGSRGTSFLHSTVRSEWYKRHCCIEKQFSLVRVDLVEGKRAFRAQASPGALPGAPGGAFEASKSSSRDTSAVSRHLRAPSRSRVRRAAGAVHGPRPAALSPRARTIGRTSTARAPSAMALSTSVPRRMPPSTSSGGALSRRAHRRCAAAHALGSAVSTCGHRGWNDQRIGARARRLRPRDAARP